MKVLQIVLKNTSTLDYTVPLMRQSLASYKDIDFEVVYLNVNRKSILRDSNFWDCFFETNNVSQYDLSDCLKPNFRFLKPVLKILFRGGKSDRIYFKEAFDFYRKNNNKVSYIGFVAFLANRFGVQAAVKSFIRSVLSYFEQRYSSNLVDLKSFLNELEADVIFFDNRSLTDFPGKKQLYDFLYQNQPKTYLLPHAPHLRDPTSEFCAFDPEGEMLPDFCEFWIPFKYGRPWEVLPERRSQFYVSGYPGLDSSWLQLCKHRDGLVAEKSKVRDESIRCLFVMRRYLPEGEKRPDDVDPYIVDFKEFRQSIESIQRCFDAKGIKVRIVIKPHPANNLHQLKYDLGQFDVEEWDIATGPIYEVLPDVDLVIGLYSTVLLMTALAGLPTALIETRLQAKVNQDWSVLNEMYTGMSGFCRSEADLAEWIEVVLSKSLDVEKDIIHIRKYFDDSSTENLLDRISHSTELKVS